MEQERFFNAGDYAENDLNEVNPLAYVVDELRLSDDPFLTLDAGAVLSVVGAYQLQLSEHHRLDVSGTMQLDALRERCFRGVDNGHPVVVERTHLVNATTYLREIVEKRNS